MTEGKCPVCARLKEICEEAGENKFCDDLLKELYDGKLNADQFVDKLLGNKKVAEKLEVKG